jgi:hypothetical protein
MLRGRTNAENEKGQDDPQSDAEGIRPENGQEGILRVDKRGTNNRDGDENRAGQETPHVLVIQAKTQKGLDKEVKRQTKGQTIVSRTDRTVCEAVVVIE